MRYTIWFCIIQCMDLGDLSIPSSASCMCCNISSCNVCQP